MNIKSLLLGSAAALVAVSGARAADAVVYEPEPVEYVKVCDAYGAGFFYIPGTETCLSISGQVFLQIGGTNDRDGGLDVCVLVLWGAGRVRQSLDFHDHGSTSDVSRGARAVERRPSVAKTPTDRSGGGVPGWRYTGIPDGDPSSLAPLPYARITEVRFPGWSLRISALRPPQRRTVFRCVKGRLGLALPPRQRDPEG